MGKRGHHWPSAARVIVLTALLLVSAAAPLLGQETSSAGTAPPVAAATTAADKAAPATTAPAAAAGDKAADAPAPTAAEADKPDATDLAAGPADAADAPEPASTVKAAVPAPASAATPAAATLAADKAADKAAASEAEKAAAPAAAITAADKAGDKAAASEAVKADALAAATPAADKAADKDAAPAATTSEAAADKAAAPAATTESAAAKADGATATETTAAAPAASTPDASSSAAAPAPAPAKATADVPAESQVVALAPQAVVENKDDINPKGACKAFIEEQCADVELGEGQVADCLSQIEKEAESSGDESGTPLSDDCNEEVMQFKISRNSNINKNIPLAKACADDANRFCNVTWFVGYRNGSVIACLRDVKDKLKPACKREVFKVQLDASYDYRADQMLHDACQKDAETLCKGVKYGGGRIQACLREQRMKLTWDCEAELFRKEIEDADDIRLSVRLFNACLADKKQFCADVPAGHAMAKQCLEEHRAELSVDCRSEIDAMIERRVRDFRLDSRLRRACESDIFDMCAYLGDVDSMDTYDSTVINCLQDFSEEIKKDACKAQVHKYLELAAQDIRYDVPLADACYKDRQLLCANVPPGSARVIRCLQNQRDKLSIVCRATLLTEEVRFSENIDFQFPMKQACLKEIDMYCKDIPHGHARVIRCLQEKKSDKHFGKACRVEVQHYEEESAKDYRLNNRLYNACKADVGQTCKDACKLQDGEICGGKVLSCLTEHKDKIKAGACKKEVAFLEKMEVNDFRTDMALAEACRADVNKFCAKVEPGEGRVHQCLRDNAAQLSTACKREEMRLEETEAESVQLNVGLLRACAGERGLFCRGVQPGGARVFRCLAENMASADFGSVCQNMILSKLQRREVNWRLDPPLRKACKEDVSKLCATEDAGRSEDGAVKRCMVAKHSELSAGCQRELGRSMHMSFFVWQPKGIVTGPCDADIQKLCLSKTQGMEVTPGAVAVCLAEIVAQSGDATNERRRLLADDSGDVHEAEDADEAEDAKQQGRKEQPGKGSAAAAKKQPGAAAAAAQSKPKQVPQLSEQCFKLAAIAEPPRVERAFDVQSAVYSTLTQSLTKVEQTTGLPTVTMNRQGGVMAISLTGWTALVGIAALVVVLLAGATIGVRQYLGSGRDGYTLVAKQQPPPPAM